MTITHDQQEKNKTYWDRERLEKFWGRNPTQEFNDRYEDFNDIQNELNAMIPVEHSMDSSPKQIRRFPSGAVRSDDTGRIRPDYISPYAEAEIAEHFTTAKNDFGPTNYFLGIEPVDIYPSMKRHMLELGEGLMKNDKAMIRNALRSLGANSVMGLHQIVMEEKGEYVKRYESTELVNAEEYLIELENGQAER
jgi:hypothetical protein